MPYTNLSTYDDGRSDPIEFSRQLFSNTFLANLTMDINTTQGMEDAKRWTTEFISLIKDGGFWAVPRSDSIYQVWHSSREFRRVSNGENCIDRVLKALGYTPRREA